MKRRFDELVRKFVRRTHSPEETLRGAGDPSGFQHRGIPGRGALLLLHGFAGTPNEMRPLAEPAVRRGMFVHAPSLPGHDGNASHLLEASWEDWAAAASAALRELSRQSEGPVIAAGLSLGSLLATHLAANHEGRVAGLVVLAPAIRFTPLSTGLPLFLLDALRPFGNRFYIPKSGADIRDPVARRKHLTYYVNPAKSAVDVLRGSRLVRPELARVKCPTLVIHGQHDRVCPVSAAHRFARKVGTSDVRVVIMPNSGHIVTSDWDREAVLSVFDAFLGKVQPGDVAEAAQAAASGE